MVPRVVEAARVVEVVAAGPVVAAADKVEGDKVAVASPLVVVAAAGIASFF